MTYEYVCEACGHQWEAEQSIKDSPLKECVACHQSKAKRLVSGGTGFLLKGGGWYADLYSSSSATKSSEPKADKGTSDKADAGGSKPSSEGSKSVSDSSGASKDAGKKAPAAASSGTTTVSAKAS